MLKMVVSQIGGFINKIEKWFQFENKILWSAFSQLFVIHAVGLYWIYAYTLPVKIQTILCGTLLTYGSYLGVTVGAHRYFSHKAFKAKNPLHILLLYLFTSAGQLSVKHWVLIHRTHHKYSDQEADPFNASRGLFYSHMGWLMLEKNELQKQKTKDTDISDINADPILRFQNKHFFPLVLLFAIALPASSAVWLWQENWRVALAWMFFIRYFAVLHTLFAVNSFGHAYGNRPYTTNTRASDNSFLSFLAIGDGWHNYHHAFPFDYKGVHTFGKANLSANFIRFFAWLGLAYDLREASDDTVKTYMERVAKGKDDVADEVKDVRDECYQRSKTTSKMMAM